MEKIKAILLSGKVSSNSIIAQNLFSTQKFGEKSGEKIVYSLSEAFFLIQENKMKLQDSKDKELTKEEILKKFNNLDKNFYLKFLVFKDLRKKGYIPKTALKFGSEFRVYDKKTDLEKSHSKWIVFPVFENTKINWQEFSSRNRVSNSTKKSLLIAIVDEEEDITYFECNWKQL